MGELLSAVSVWRSLVDYHHIPFRLVLTWNLGRFYEEEEHLVQNTWSHSNTLRNGTCVEVQTKILAYNDAFLVK